MRFGVVALSVLSIALLLPAPVVAEWGPYGDDGWPVNADGESTNPLPGSPDPRLIALGLAPPLNEIAGNTVYPYWPVLTAEMQTIAAEHPDLVRLHSIGKSSLGLDLWMLEIADFARIEAGEGLSLTHREVVWVDGGTHSNEYSGVYFVTHLARFLTDEYATNETARWIVENRHTWLMPMVNPDGSNAFGRLNANLVNINRNYPVVWDGEGHDAFLNNRGPHPASEVETQLNIEWFNKTRPDYYASIHCCGNLWLYPYGEEGVDPADQAMLQRVCDEAFPAVRSDCGPIWSTIYPASGSSVDTVYEYTGAVAFGYEMSGRGAGALWGLPFTTASVREQEIESWTGVMHAFLNVHRYGAYPVVTGVTADTDGLLVTLRNDGLGDLTGTVTVGLGEGVEAPAAARALAQAIGPGQSITVRVDATLSEGNIPLLVTYTKRLEATPVGTTFTPLVVERNADGVLTAHLGDGTLLGTVAPPLDDETIPAPLVLPLLAALGLLMALRRRG